MPVGQRTDPFLAFNFLVEIDDLVVGGFSEVSGLQVEIEVHDYREGGLNEYIHKLAGPTRYPSNLTLKRGLMDTDVLGSWLAQVTQGVVQRRNGSIVLLDATGQEAARWNFTAAYPVRWKGPDLQASSSAVAVETLELAHHGLTRSP
jgi:phage tail-like protein